MYQMQRSTDSVSEHTQPTATVNRGCKLVNRLILTITVPILYLALSAPLLWSTTKIEHPVWLKTVKIYFAPIVGYEEWCFTYKKKRELAAESTIDDAETSVIPVGRWAHYAPESINLLYRYWGLFGVKTFYRYCDDVSPNSAFLDRVTIALELLQPEEEYIFEEEILSIVEPDGD